MNTLSSMARGALAAAAALACTLPAQATISVFTTQASFSAVATAAFTDTFNDMVLDFAPSPTTRPNGAYGYRITSEGGLYGTGSMADVWLSTNLSGDTLTFSNFTGTVRGLGGLFFATDLVGQPLAGQTLTLTATDALGATATTTITNATQSSFAGFVSTDSLLTSVTVSITDRSAWATVNNLVLSSTNTPVVPEPGALTMMLAGLLAVATIARRRSSR